jgi:hypothetical protein
MAQEDLHRECYEAAKSATLEEFCQRWTGHYLLVNIPGGDSDEWDMDFHTDVLSIDKLKAGMRDTVLPEPDADEEQAPPGTYLYEIKKHADNSWLEWIAIGRARNNDLILRHQSVSKLHARIHFDQHGAAGGAPGGSLWLTDMKSTAGTLVNDAALIPSEPCRLGPGDMIRFGQVTCDFLDSAALFRKLQSRRR